MPANQSKKLPVKRNDSTSIDSNSGMNILNWPEMIPKTTGLASWEGLVAMTEIIIEGNEQRCEQVAQLQEESSHGLQKLYFDMTRLIYENQVNQVARIMDHFESCLMNPVRLSAYWRPEKAVKPSNTP